MASSYVTYSTVTPVVSSSNIRGVFRLAFTRRRVTLSPNARRRILRVSAKASTKNAMEYRKLGDSDLNISEVTMGTMTFGEQNTEKESHEMLSYAIEEGINCIDTAEAVSFYLHCSSFSSCLVNLIASVYLSGICLVCGKFSSIIVYFQYPIPMKKETQGKTDLYISSWLKSQQRDKIVLATKVCGYSERSAYIRDSGEILRVDAANIKESVEKSLKRLGTDYIDLLQIHWPDRYVPLFGDFYYETSKWRPSVPFAEQLRAFQDLIVEGKVRYIGVSNETSYGVTEFVNTAKLEGLPKIVSIQNGYSLLVRCRYEVDLVEVCHPKNCNVGLLAYSPLGGGSLSGKYLATDQEATKNARLNLFPGYMERYKGSLAKEATIQYVEVAKKYGLTPVELALGFVRDRPFVTSTIIGATSVKQLKEDIDAFLMTERPFSQEVMADIDAVFKRFKDPSFV
ncbi:Similar to Babesia aldo-keto reductase (gb/M93122) [Arabidopsis thaliana]|uniref:F19P19.12 protein n=3 Tax=Arabidopsis thaliana TaxID=3702 RepID=P93818_ARATH|nr:Similar to Babesia aldo-keto reductase (gb/M93122) [Arabidopsis thaliana]